MLEFGGLYANPVTMSAFVTGSAVGIALNAMLAAWLLVKADRVPPEVRPHTSGLKIVAATAGVTLFLLTGITAAIGLVASHRQALAVSTPDSLSVEAIQKGIDVKALPTTVVSDHM